MKDRVVKQAAQWISALAAGFLIVNGLCFAYERPVGWLDTPAGASAAVWRPGTVIVHGTEGYGLSRVDENGFLNPSLALGDRYVLMMGSSHTQGKEISPNKRYCALVNDYFSGDSGLLTAYNIAGDGQYLPSQLRHFAAAVTAFPDAGAITIEIGSTDFSARELRESLNQPAYDPADSAGGFAAMGLGGRIKTAVKEGFPLLSLLKKNRETLLAKANPGGGAAAKSDWEGYEEALDQALSLIRSEFDGPIAFVYHPATKLNPDGTLNVPYSETWDSFRRVCEKHSMDVIDTGPRFRTAFESSHRLPYGFANTKPGDGHLNALGHRIVAEEMISWLEEQRV